MDIVFYSLIQISLVLSEHATKSVWECAQLVFIFLVLKIIIVFINI